MRSRSYLRRFTTDSGWSSWLLPVVLLAIAVVATWRYVLSLPTAVLSDRLTRWHFWNLELLLVLVALLVATLLPSIKRHIRPNRKEIGSLLSFSILAALLVTLVAPRTSRIFYDEQIYVNTAQNLADLHRAQFCNEGTVEFGALICQRSEYNKQPFGYPHLLSLAFRTFGTSDAWGYRLNNLVLVLLPWVVWLTTLLLFKDRSAALWAALVSILIPEQMIWSATAAAEPTAALMAACALLAAVWFAVNPSALALVSLVVITVWAANFRPESVLCLPLVLLVVLILAPCELRKPRILWAALLGWILSLGIIGHLFVIRYNSWGATGDRLSWRFVHANLDTNGLYYINNERWPLLFTLLVFIGLMSRSGRVLLVPASQFLIFGGVFLFFYAGSYRYGADVRYALISLPPLAILAGRGAAAVSRRLNCLFGARRVAIAFLGLLLLVTTQFLPLVRSVGEEAWGARADVEVARAFVEGLPTNSVVFTHNPNMFLVWGVNSAQASLALDDPGYIRDHFFGRFAGGVYFHWNFWCNVDDPEQTSLCQSVLRRYPHRLIAEEAYWTYRYRLFRLEPPPEAHR